MVFIIHIFLYMCQYRREVEFQFLVPVDHRKFFSFLAWDENLFANANCLLKLLDGPEARLSSNVFRLLGILPMYLRPACQVETCLPLCGASAWSWDLLHLTPFWDTFQDYNDFVALDVFSHCPTVQFRVVRETTSGTHPVTSNSDYAAPNSEKNFCMSRLIQRRRPSYQAIQAVPAIFVIAL